MNLPVAIYAIRWLIRDTFRQAQASGLFWLLLGVSGLCIAFCLSVSVQGGSSPFQPGENPEFLTPPVRGANESAEDFRIRYKKFESTRAEAKKTGVDIIEGVTLNLAFGAFQIKQARYREETVYFLELLLAGFVADAGGILLTLVWTAGFLPSFLEPSAAAVLFAKPVPRWTLLIGKYLGVLVFVLFQATVFVAGTWLALGIRTGFWDGTYLLCIPLLLIHFAIFYSFSAFMAVCTRSTIGCVISSVLFWFLCWAMNFGRHQLVATPEVTGISPILKGSVEAGYWILPKPADLQIILVNALHGENNFPLVTAFRQVQKQGAFSPDMSVLASLLFTVAILGLAAYQLALTDY